MIRYKCLLCLRNKFDRPSPHRCNGQYRKRGLKWEMVEKLSFVQWVDKMKND